MQYDAVLISPPSRMINHYRPPLALLYIAGYLRHMGWSVKIIDRPMDQIVRDRAFLKNIPGQIMRIEALMLEELKNLHTRVLGITFYTPEYQEVMTLARAAKKAIPGVTVIAGGIHPALYPDEAVFTGSPIDIAVNGEGETVMHEILTALAGQKSLADVNGIAYYNPHLKKTVKTSSRAVSGLDEISYPAYDLVDMNYYLNASPYAIRGCFLRAAYVLGSRGCPSQCTFCVAVNLRRQSLGKAVRMRSAESMFAEISDLKKNYLIDAFYFIDDLFTIDKENIMRFCNLLVQNKSSVIWGCSAKASTLDEEMIASMARSGCVQIDFGVERGSDQALAVLKKGITLQIIRKVFALCRKYRIRTFANFLVNTPGETAEDLADIEKLICELKPDIVAVNIFTPYPGTEIYRNCSFRFDIAEYPMLTAASRRIYKDRRLKFCSHAINVIEWADRVNRKYNSLFRNMRFYLNPRYWRVLLSSGAKINYLKQAGLLLREVVNQKFSRYAQAED
ncbi:MAG TPA: hypothetical protein DC049_17175 [Spirochaetia bacterium]|nr:hypothetical protein [Spirochaetia bacterium]